MNNVVFIPYHDWRKIIKEGNRTRDAHFIDSFRNSASVDKVLLINRPITRAELIIKKKSLSVYIEGKIVLSNRNCKLIEIDNKTYLIDFVSLENIKHIISGRKWYFEAFAKNVLKSFFRESLKFLNIENYQLISANIFAERFIDIGMSQTIKFDGWDNFAKMAEMSAFVDEIKNAYKGYATKASCWSTNSLQNVDYYKKNFGIKDIKLITNGVDFDKFESKYPLPPDLEKIKLLDKPIIGFGGKISSLIDVDLFSYVMEKNSDLIFVVIGQILDKVIFSKLSESNNMYYLGDKRYNEYIKYVTNFDVGIIPYVTGEKGHGADSIKTYEYIAARIPVVASNGNGAQQLNDYITIANNKEEFSKLVRSAKVKNMLPSDVFSWNTKTQQLLDA